MPTSIRVKLKWKLCWETILKIITQKSGFTLLWEWRYFNMSRWSYAS